MTDPRMIAAGMAHGLAQPGFGLVSAVDPVNHAVKVTLQPSGVESGWVPYGAMQVGSLRIACMPDTGTHVLVTPIEGDAEHAVIACPVYDAVMMPPLSPATGQVAQPGEVLIVSGCAPPPAQAGGVPGSPGQNAPWWHMTKTAIHAGAGDATATLNASGLTWAVGGVTMALTADGLAMRGGSITTDRDMTAQGTVTGQADVKAAGVSGREHTHPVGSAPGVTGTPQ
ncbi:MULTISPECIES: phage baseplate assembly protein V [Komagataeibacter]|uniref:phage baseplate assembly protein V n=1 Tax=Komagataeibacter TaxID=1434011 RepID=UPI0024A8307C|nr:phage baseplate assembly protein V [Komagataeibacter saccharivorans]